MYAYHSQAIEEHGTRRPPQHNTPDPRHDRNIQRSIYERSSYSTRPQVSRKLDGRGNAPARIAMLQMMQQTQGNRAVQRFIQRASSGQGPAIEGDIGSRIESRSGGGSSLDSGAQSKLESGLGADMSGVRVHTDGEADRLSKSVGATAFTTGQNIFFSSGAYNPGTQDGMKLLAHEATHTVQQSQGPVAGTPQPGGISVSDPSDSYEQAAEQTAEHVVSAPEEEESSTPAQRKEEAGSGVTTSVQRAPEEASDSQQLLQNPLVGLTRGDGLNFGTEERRQRVIMLQDKLNEKLQVSLNPDGKFGKETSKALKQFQNSINLPQQETVDQSTGDALMGGKDVVGGGGTGNTVPPGGATTNITIAGDNFVIGGAQLKKAGTQLLRAGMFIASRGDENSRSAFNPHLLKAGQDIEKTGTEMEQGGQNLKADVNGSGIAAAAININTAGTSMHSSGRDIMMAGAFLRQRGDPGSSEILNHMIKGGTAAEKTGTELQSAGVNMQESTAGPPPGSDLSNLLFGLVRGDGIKFGFDKKVNVMLLQAKLNEKLQSSLDLDGKFGGKTGAALMDFQGTMGGAPVEFVDRLTADSLADVKPNLNGAEGLGLAGDNLVESSKSLTTLSEEVALTGGFIRQGNDPGDKDASTETVKVAVEMFPVSANLEGAGLSFKGGTPPSP